MLPTVAVLGVVIGYPVVYTLVLSTQKFNLLDTTPARFIGGANYTHLSIDPIFWSSLANTAIYTFGSVAIAALLGLALALLTENLLGWRFRAVRALLLTPWAVPFVVVAFLFRYMYLQDGGVINAILLRLGLIAHPVLWLNNATLALPAIMVANVWTMVPFFFLLLSAALAAVPTEVIEAASIDRAGPFSMIVYIKLPFLKNALLVSSLLMAISNVNDFAKIWAMTEGGPGYSTTTLVVYVYRLAFEDFNFGYASAIGVVWLVLLLGFAWLYLRTLRMP
ncbi:MAG TPA: sugar ABC transporter permease [Bryocella sp.]|nr:sugar ABC transporter permease [Bryocella sp.]